MLRRIARDNGGDALGAIGRRGVEHPGAAHRVFPNQESRTVGIPIKWSSSGHHKWSSSMPIESFQIRRVERLAFQERLAFRDAFRVDEGEERVRADEREERSEQTRVRSGSEQTRVRSGSEQTRVRSGSEQTRERSGSEQTRVRSGSEQTRERSGSEQTRVGSGSEQTRERSGVVSGRQYTADERDALCVHSDSGELGRDVEELVDGARERLRIVLGGPSAATWHAKDETRCDLGTDGMGWG
jgi:hypothetical protein